MKLRFFLLILCLFNSSIALASLDKLQSLIKNQQFKQAIALGEKLSLEYPDSPSVLFYTAFAYQNKGQLNQAKQLYLSALKNKQPATEIYNNLAMIYAQQQNYNKAAEILTLAINSNKSTATAYANLSQIYRHLASQAYQQVLNDGSVKRKQKPNIKPQLLSHLSFQENLIAKPIQVAQIIPKKPIPVVTKKIIIAPVKITTTSKPEVMLITRSAQQAIIDWAQAWQKKDLTAYLASYSKDYAPKNLSHLQWKQQRQKRISKPGGISISVSNFEIKQVKQNNQTTKAFINFDQIFKSTSYQDKVRKRMHLILIDKQWYISSEVTLSVL